MVREVQCNHPASIFCTRFILYRETEAGYTLNWSPFHQPKLWEEAGTHWKQQLKPSLFLLWGNSAHCYTIAPSLCHHCAITAPSLRHHCATPAPSLCHHCAITAPPLRHPCAITVPPLCHHCGTTVEVRRVKAVWDHQMYFWSDFLLEQK